MTATDRLFNGSALRFLAVLAAAALAFTLLPLAGTASGQEQPDATDACPDEPAPAPFDDRDDIPDVHVRNVDCAFERNIVEGFADNTYRPSLSVRRDQMASYIARMLRAAGYTLPDPDEHDGFDDVPSGNVHSDNIESLAAAGIIVGTGGGNYSPGNDVRRDQVTSFALRSAEWALEEDFASNDQAFDDVPPGNVHFRNVNGAADLGIVVGGPGNLPSNMFGPSLSTRRDQMAAIVARTLVVIETFEEPATPEPTPGDVRETFTEAPELLRVEEVSVTTNQVVLRFIYDEEIRANPVLAANHRIYSWDGTWVGASSAQRDPNNTSAVLAAFGRAAYDSATTATVAFQAVQDTGGTFNPEAHWPLRDIVQVEGQTVAPDVLRIENFRQATAPATDALVDFVFDETVAGFQPAPATPFSLIWNSGRVLTGFVHSVGGTNNTVVTVQVPMGAQEPDNTGAPTGPASTTGVANTQAQTRRAAVQPNAVMDAAGNTNVLQTADFQLDGITSTPDLVDVTYDFANDQAAFFFDESVTVTNVAGLLAYYRNATTTAAGAVVAAQTSGPQVTVQYATGALSEATVAGASAAAGSVARATDATVTNRDDEVGRSGSFQAGAWPGPILTGVAYNPTTDAFGNVTMERGTWTFDKEVAVTNPGNFAVYSQAGARQAMTTCTARTTANEQNIVDCTATLGTTVGNAIRDAALGAVAQNAVQNRLAPATMNYEASYGMS